MRVTIFFKKRKKKEKKEKKSRPAPTEDSGPMYSPVQVVCSSKLEEPQAQRHRSNSRPFFFWVITKITLNFSSVGYPLSCQHNIITEITKFFY